MIVTKEHQAAIVEKYVKEKHSTDECVGFIDGINATIALINKLTIPVVTQSCDTCKHLSACRFWQEAPNNGATCKFYIKHVA